MTTYEEASEALKRLRSTPQWAWAFGHGCSLGGHPDYDKIRAEDARLLAIIKEHKP